MENLNNKFWKIDPEKEKSEGLKSELKTNNNENIELKTLEQLGLLYLKLDGNEKNDKLEEIAKEKGYKNRDKIKFGEKITENYYEFIKKFAVEHIHDGEEIRYILDGSGYFDVRDKNNEWIRIFVSKGDLIVLPAGIYHRFSPDNSNYFHAMRLFQDEPKWTAYSRPECDDRVSRANYLLKYLK